MGAERIREIGRQLRNFAEWAQGEYINLDVEIEDNDYYVDLGVFGEQSMGVTVREDKSFDADDMLDNYPLNSGTFFEYAEELEVYEEPEPEEASLDSVLTRMEENGEALLVGALRAVIEAFQGTVLKAMDMSGLSIGPLPPKPLPWPGALRPEIDYTAADFPLRYQPPPGYDWTESSEMGRVPYDKAVAIDAVKAAGGTLVMDSLGRARWYNRDDTKDTYTEGKRWRIWYFERDGIPSGNGFNGSDPPRAFDADGVPIEEPGVNTDKFFRRVDDREKTRLRVREIRLAYEQEYTPKNEYGVSYDPKTVPLESVESYVNSELLRVGDAVNSFGRLVRVSKRDDGQYDHTFLAGDGREFVDTRARFEWAMTKIVGWDSQPTALSLSNGAPPEQGSVDYDPLTVPVQAGETLVESKDLRLGDDITGKSFGRVTAIENNEIVMSRDGNVNRTPYYETFKWSVLMIDVPNRDSVPRATELQPAAV
jgi:hypothetical protein